MIGNVIPIPWTTIVTSGSNPSYSNEYCFNFEPAGLNPGPCIAANIPSTMFSKTSSFTAASWFRFRNTSLSSGGGILGNTDLREGFIMRANVSGGNIEVLTQLSGSLSGFPNGNFDVVDSSLSLDTNWHLMVVTYDGSETAAGFKVYVDNSSAIVSSSNNWTSSTNSTNSNQFYLGANRINLSSVYFNGNLDEMSLYDYEMNSSNVNTLWNSGVPGDIVSDGLNPKHWYRMGESATWDNTNWTLIDQGDGNINGVSSLMNENDRIIRPT